MCRFLQGCWITVWQIFSPICYRYEWVSILNNCYRNIILYFLMFIEVSV